jgi:mRNA interferase MazF
MTASGNRRGEIWLVDFRPGRGSEQKGLRPALVIQNDIGNRHASTTIVAAVTTTIRPYPVTVLLERNEGGLQERSMVNMAQILTLDKTRLIRKLGSLSSERLVEIDTALMVSLDLAP